jgi:hypothetical protein
MANKRLNTTIVIGGTITGALKGALGAAESGLKKISGEMGRVTKRQVLLGKSIQTFSRMGKDVSALRSEYAKTVDTIDRLRRAQERLNREQSRYTKAKGVAGSMRGAATTVGASGLAIGGVLATGIHAAVKRENEVNIIKNSGLSAADQKSLISAAGGSRQFGVSVTDAFKTARELQASLGSASHAVEALPTALQAKSGLQLYNREHAGHEVEDGAMYALAKIADERGGASSAEEMRKQMDYAFRGITASQGKVSAEDWLAAQRGAKAAGIGASHDAFFGDSFMVQALGAPQYGKAISTLNNAWIGGHQDAHKFTNMLADGLLDRRKVKLKNGLVTNYKSDALVDNKLLIEDQQAWVEKHLLPLAKRKGVNLGDSAAVQKFVSDYTSNTNAGNVLFQRMFNRTAIERDRTNYKSAHGIEESDKANQQSTAGKVDNARARLDDAQERVGRVLIPAFATAMERTADVLEKVNRFADENPRLMKGIVMGLGGLAVGLTVAAPLLVTAGGALQLFATIRLARSVASLRELEGAANGVNGAAGGAAKGILGFIGKLGMAATLAEVALGVAKAAGLPDVDAGKGADDVKNGRWWAASAHLPAGDFLRALAARTGGKSNAEISASLTGGQNPTAPTVPPLATARSASAAPAQDNRQYHVEFHQQPGQPGKDAAREVMTRLGAPANKLGSGLYDTGF